MRRLASLAVLLAACGRSGIYEAVTPPTPPVTKCTLSLDTETLDWGTVAINMNLVRGVVFTNTGDGACRLSTFTVVGAVDFVLAPPGITELAPGDSVRLSVSFFAPRLEAPFDRTGALVVTTNDPARPRVTVPLKAHLAHCELRAEPERVVFTPLRPGQSEVQDVVLSNAGDATCVISTVAINSAAGFSFAGGPPPTAVMPGAKVELPLRFTANAAQPAKRTGTLRVAADASGTLLTVALEATILFCEWVASPSPFDFGNVMLNTTANASVTFTNRGLDTCVLSGFFLQGDPVFTLPVSPGTLTLQPGGTAQVAIRFAAFQSAPPHARTSSLRFTSNDPAQPMGAVPVAGFISTLCNQAGQFIYTVDRNGIFSRFDPSALTSTPVGTLSCMNGTMPFSMNLDQTATAWVVFDDGRLHQVDVTTAACTSTSFVPNQNGFSGFGMGSVFDATTGKDTLYIAGGPTFRTLGTLDLGTLTTSVIGNISAQSSELAGTGDGQLWAFVPRSATANGIPFMERIEPRDAGTLEHHDLTAITSTGGYAIKFWGGAFYIFIGADVWKVPRSTLVPTMNAPTAPPTLVFSRPGLEVVGAGVSTCAPVMGP